MNIMWLIFHSGLRIYSRLWMVSIIPSALPYWDIWLLYGHVTLLRMSPGHQAQLKQFAHIWGPSWQQIQSSQYRDNPSSYSLITK